jgi:hypothetical protein
MMKFFNCNLSEGYFTVMVDNEMFMCERSDSSRYRILGDFIINCHWHYSQYQFELIITSNAGSMSGAYAGAKGEVQRSMFYASAIGLELFEASLINAIALLQKNEI